MCNVYQGLVCDFVSCRFVFRVGQRYLSVGCIVSCNEYFYGAQILEKSVAQFRNTISFIYFLFVFQTIMNNDTTQVTMK